MEGKKMMPTYEVFKNDNWYYQPNEEHGMSDLSKSIISQCKTVKVHGNEFNITDYRKRKDEIRSQLKLKVNNSNEINAKEYQGFITLFLNKGMEVKLNVNNKRGVVNFKSPSNNERIELNNDFSVAQISLDAKQEFGITFPKNNKDKLLALQNKTYYYYDKNHDDTIKSASYESYEINGIGKEKLIFKEIPTPHNATDEEKEQIKYKNTQGKQLCDFLNYTIENKQDVRGEVFFVEGDNSAENNCYYLDERSRNLFQYGKNKMGLKEMKLVKENVDEVLFNKNDSVFYIFQKDPLNKNNKVLALDYPSMNELSCKEVGDLEEEILPRMAGKKPVEIIDESVFNKRVKEYFNKQVKKEQALNQDQVENNVDNQVQISLKSREAENVNEK